MTTYVNISAQFITTVESTVELPEGYTQDDIHNVYAKWGDPTLTMKDGMVFGPMHYANVEASLKVISSVNGYEDGDDTKHPEYVSVRPVKLDSDGDTDWDTLDEPIVEYGETLYT